MEEIHIKVKVNSDLKTASEMFKKMLRSLTVEELDMLVEPRITSRMYEATMSVEEYDKDKEESGR